MAPMGVDLLVPAIGEPPVAEVLLLVVLDVGTVA